MAIQNRTTTLPGIWAENAQTTIPTPPVAGVTYRDTTLNSTAIDKAWPFKTIVDSSDFNQHAFLQDTLIKEAEQYGIMRWNNTTTYKEGGFCLGQDGKLYQAKRDNQGKEPTASSDDWGEELAPYQLKSNLSQALDSSTEKYPSNKAVLDSINGRANLALSNVSSDGKIVISTQGKPSARYDDLTLGPNGEIYTAVANGWFSYQGNFTANNGAFFSNISTGFCSGSCRSSSTSTAPMGGSIPARKGEQVAFYYAGFIKDMFRFYYDEGMK